MGVIRIGAVSAHFGRNLDADLDRIAGLVDRARESGVGLLVLFRVNRPMKENLRILLLLFVVGVLAGLLVDVTGLSALL